MKLEFPGPALLFCPGDRPDRFEKAVDAGDGVIIDWEDGVGAGGKHVARRATIEALRQWSHREVIIRINAEGTRWYDEDRRSLTEFPDAVVMLPKAESADAVAALAPHPVVALCETARGVLTAADVASAENCVGVMWGSEDLLANLGARPEWGPDGRYAPVLEEARIRILYAARAAGVTPIDSILADFSDLELLAAVSRAAAAAGYLAKACIHPRQVDVVRAAFRPTETDIAWAREVLAAADRSTGGAFVVRGRMVDEPTLVRARDILRRADR